MITVLKKLNKYYEIKNIIITTLKKFYIYIKKF